MTDPNSSSPSGGDALKKQTTRLLYPEAVTKAPTVGREGKPQTAPGLPPEAKKQTSRIPLDAVLPAGQAKPETKRVITPPPSIAPEAVPLPATPKTIQLKRPMPSVLVKPGETGKVIPATIRTPTSRVPLAPTAVREPPPEAKRKTAQVIVDESTVVASPEELKRSTTLISGVPIPQTIQLKRPGSLTGTFKPPTVAQVRLPTAPVTEAPTVVRAQPKPQTSRIVLTEAPTVKKIVDAKPATSVITGIPTSAAGPIPQTIRLKRPISSAVLPVKPAGAEVAAAKKSETAKIELPTEESQLPLTQRKTIKIKRTERNVAPRTVTLPRSPAMAEPTVTGAAAAPAPATDNLIFTLAAVAAVILAAGLVYLLVAQGSGPNLVLPVPSALL